MNSMLKIMIVCGIFLIAIFGVFLFRYYKGCYDYSCVYICDENDYLTKLFYRCGTPIVSNEIEKWDYKIYGETFSQAGYDYCIENTNHSDEDCKYLNTCRKIKLYGDSYCNINCGNFSYKVNLTLDNLNKAIPAQYINISSEFSKCIPECYGEFRGLTCEAFGGKDV